MKKYIIGFLIGLFVCGIIGVSAATYLYHSDEVSYTPSNNDWKVNNVNDALNDLYSKTDIGSIPALNFASPLHVFVPNQAWTATEDCVLLGSYGGISNVFTIDGTQIEIDTGSSAVWRFVPYTFVKKGQVVKFNSATNQGNCNVRAYKLLSGNMPALNFSNPLHVFVANQAWTATEDCYLLGSYGGISNVFTIDGTQIEIDTGSSAVWRFVHYIFVKKGQIVKFNSATNQGNCNVRAFKEI